MLQRKLGKTNIEASVVAFGAWAIGADSLPEETPTTALSEVQEEDTEGRSPKWLLLGGLCLGLFLIAGAVFYFLVIRNRALWKAFILLK